jgi:RNA polymerase sigma-70 factor, ECF subfamily
MAAPPAELDELTLARAQRGDTGAFRDLVMRYQRPVSGLLWRVLGKEVDPELVDDLSQEVFLAVYRALPGFAVQGPARLGSWILSIAARTALGELRRLGRWRRRQAAFAVLVRDQRVPPAATEQRALGAAVERMLGGLTPDHRAVVVLREYHGFEYEEIAAALGIDVGTVRSRLARARAALRLLLPPEGP